jgi:hypothetical protein
MTKPPKKPSDGSTPPILVVVQPDKRLVIHLPGVRREIVDKLIKLMSELEVFQRGGGLVDIVRDPETGPGNVTAPTGDARIRITPFLRVIELAQTVCKFMARKRTELGSIRDYVEVDPPANLVRTMMDRGEWAHLRALEAMVSWPVLRPDGTIFDGLGYDAQTLYYATSNIAMDLPKKITWADVKGAVETINDVVCDFPFERPEHKSAWIAALLGVIARPAIDGPVPMLVVDANDRGVGKTLLCDTLGAILSGKRLPRSSVPGGEEEWQKAMLSIGIGGNPIQLLDNVTGILRSSTLAQVLTGEDYLGRVLGWNRMLKVQIRTQFLVSSNNATVDTDLVRRSLHCRLLAENERPEQRDGFRYTLPGDAAAPEMRRELLTAAVKILLGYQQAGRPKVQARTLGSYGAWSEQVQRPLVWAGLADPVLTQDEFRKQADPEREQLEALLEAWYEFFAEEQITVSNAMTRVRAGTAMQPPDEKAMNLLAALETLSEIPGHPVTAAKVGFRLRSWREKWVNQKSFFGCTHEGGARKWCVRKKLVW